MYGIVHAELCNAPFAMPRPRLAHLKLGLRYERQCQEVIKRCAAVETNILFGPWMRHTRQSGERGICQPDIVLLEPEIAAVIECKNTWTDSAFEQLALYKEVCGAIFQREVIGFQMCKHLTGRTRGKVCYDLQSASAFAVQDEIVTLHWSGRGAI